MRKISNSLDTRELVFDDVLIDVKFSTVGSRKSVILDTELGNVNNKIKLSLPIISSNMESITGPRMAREMHNLGGMGILHRFCSIEENVNIFLEAVEGLTVKPNIGCSIGISPNELDRAISLYDVGCRIFCIDVAHGAQLEVVNQAINIRSLYGDSVFLIVGNFTNTDSIFEFEEAFEDLSDYVGTRMPDMYKVGIGSGAICSTRLKTGVGRPLFSSVLDCSRKYNIIADGGFKKPGDVCKALGAGAKLIMTGSMLSGTDEAAGTVKNGNSITTSYWGSASGGYAQGNKTSEGVIAKHVEYKGAVKDIIKDIEGGLRSSMTYTNSLTLDEYRENVTFTIVSSNTIKENKTVND